MRRYELMIIITDTLEEDDAKQEFERAKTVLEDQGGTVLDEAWWGRRRFTYEINNRDYGYYAVLDLRATAEAVAEVERQLKISDHVVRYKTVRPEIRVRSNA